jgi:alpha-D-xyloside xylohydrolase
MIFTNQSGALIARRMGETLRIEPWGRDSLRVRATMQPAIEDQNWALTEPVESGV